MRAVDSPGLLNVTNARLAYLSGAMYCVQPSLWGVLSHPAGASNFTLAVDIVTVLPPPVDDEDDDDLRQHPVVRTDIPISPQKASPAMPCSFIRQTSQEGLFRRPTGSVARPAPRNVNVR